MDQKRSGFRRWLCEASPHFTWDWDHQLYLFERLERVTTGETKRMMIMMPPRHSKSETVTIHYSAYRIERNPALNVIIASYNQKLANRFSRRVRRIAEDRRWRLAADRRSAEEWETAAGGGVRAVGVGAGVTGFGAGLIVIDDPVKNRAQAESATYRQRTWDWFNDDIYTRLEPGASLVLIQTRWHEDDLAGRLLREADAGGEKWEVVKLAALADEGDPLGRKPGMPLCPSRFGEADLMRIKARLGSYSFSALYQQEPVPTGGGIFKREWLNRVVERAPDGLRWVRGYDLAVSTKTTADHTASFRCALDERSGILYIADGFRGRIEFPEQRRYIRERIEHERDTRHCIESALHGQAFVQELQREVKFAGRSISAIRPDGDKTTRALPWAARAEAGKLVLVRGPWISDLIEEVCRFPNSKHDDQVDAISLAVQMIAKLKSKTAKGF